MALFDRVRIKIIEELFERSINYFTLQLSKKNINLTVGTKSTRNMIVNNFVLTTDANDEIQKWCVVFQGKIYNFEFAEYLEETLLHIRNQIPKIEIIVATYEDENFVRLKSFCLINNISIVVVEDVGSLPPPYPQSLCQQIESSFVGLKMAQELGYENSIKIRVDQRIDVLMSILLVSQYFESFPSRNQETLNRIWGTSYNTYLHQPLALSDMVQFGKTNDLLKYWNKINIQDWVSYLNELQRRYTDNNWHGFAMPETWLAARYLDSMKISLSSPEDTNSIFWEDFSGVVNANSVGQEWRKTFGWLSTNYHTIKWFRNLYDSKFLEMRNEDWLIIHYLGRKIRNKKMKMTFHY